MNYAEIQKLNQRAAAGRAAMYIARSESRMRRFRWSTLLVVSLGAGLIVAGLDDTQLRKLNASINAEQQVQAAQHADDRLWYQSACEPVSETSGTITCVPNPELGL
jgi:hypothetical protein